MKNKLYDHAFTLAFSLKSFNEGEKVTVKELRAALLRRLADLEEHDDWLEAIGLPYDTYEDDL